MQMIHRKPLNLPEDIFSDCPDNSFDELQRNCHIVYRGVFFGNIHVKKGSSKKFTGSSKETNKILSSFSDSEKKQQDVYNGLICTFKYIDSVTEEESIIYGFFFRCSNFGRKNHEIGKNIIESLESKMKTYNEDVIIITKTTNNSKDINKITDWLVKLDINNRPLKIDRYYY